MKKRSALRNQPGAGDGVDGNWADGRKHHRQLDAATYTDEYERHYQAMMAEPLVEDDPMKDAVQTLGKIDGQRDAAANIHDAETAWEKRRMPHIDKHFDLYIGAYEIAQRANK